MAPTYFGDGDSIAVGGYQVEFTTGDYITHSQTIDDGTKNKYFKSGDYLFLGDKTKGFCMYDKSEITSSTDFLVTGEYLLRDVKYYLNYYSFPYVEELLKETYAEIMPYYTACSDFGGYTTPGAEKWILQTKDFIAFKEESKSYGAFPLSTDRPIEPIYSSVITSAYTKKIRTRTKISLASLESLPPPSLPFSRKSPTRLELYKGGQSKMDFSGYIDFLYDLAYVAFVFIATPEFPVYLIHKDKVTPYDIIPPRNPVPDQLVEVTDVDIFEVQRTGAMVHIDASDYSLDSTPLYFGFTLPAQIFYKQNIYDYIEAIELPTGGYELPDLRDRGIFVKQNEPGIRWLTYHPDGNCVQYNCPRCTNLYVRI